MNRIINEIFDYMNEAKYFRDEQFENYFVNIIKSDYEKKERPKDHTETVLPVWSGLKVTGKCNFRCEHCWAALAGEEKSIEEIFRAVDKLEDMGIKHITVSGGEPFLRTDIMKIIEYIKKKKFHISLYTNGSLLNKEKIEYLERILDGIDVIQVSVDGSNETIFFKQRKTKLFDVVKENLLLLGKSKLVVRANMVATSYNLHDIENVYALCNEYNIDTFSLSYVYGLNKGEELCDTREIEQFLEKIYNCILLSRQYKTKFKPFIPSQIYCYLDKSMKSEREIRFFDYYSLLYRFINDKGDMYPDVSMEYEELKIGNIFNDETGVLLQNSIMIGNQLKVRNLEKTKCKNCCWIEECQGGDMGRAYKEYRDINHADPYCTRKN